MTLSPTKDPIDLPQGATIKRPDLAAPFVSFSSRSRWSKCALSAVLPQLRTPSGPAAEEGTEAHKVAEWALAEKFKIGTPADMPVVVPPQGLDGFTYTEQAINDWQAQVGQHAITYADNAASLFRDCAPGTHCMIEVKVGPTTIHGVKVGGVADALLWNDKAKRLVGGDYKYGRSPVGAGSLDEPNPQVAAAMVLWARQAPHLEPDQLGGFVYQPRVRYGDAWQCWGTTDATAAQNWMERESDKLHDELAAVARAASELAAGRLVDPTPGDHCTYCPSARWCPAAAAYGQAALQVEAGTKAVVDWTPEEVMAIWAQRSAFNTFYEDLKERVKMLQEANHPAVQVRRRTGNRVWANPAAVVEALFLADAAHLLQPPGLEKASAALSEAEIAALVTRAPDVLTFVATDGKQPDKASDAFAKYLQEKQ